MPWAEISNGYHYHTYCPRIKGLFQGFFTKVVASEIENGPDSENAGQRIGKSILSPCKDNKNGGADEFYN